MTNFIFKPLGFDDVAAYMVMCAAVDVMLARNNQQHFMDFMTLPQCHDAILDKRIFTVWENHDMMGSIIIEPCNIKQRLETRFTGDALDDLDFDGVYLRNGMVRPDQQGRGIYTRLMKEVLAIYSDIPVVNTMNVLNIPPQCACAAAGFSAVGRIVRVKDKMDTLILARLPQVEYQARVA